MLCSVCCVLIVRLLRVVCCLAMVVVCRVLFVVWCVLFVVSWLYADVCCAM